MFRHSVWLSALCAAALLAGCVQHRTQIVSVEASAAAIPEAPTGPLSFEEAVRLLVDRHPGLAATRAAIGAVNLSPGPQPLVGSVQIMDGRAGESILRTDLLSLLGLGPRKAELALARAMRDERIRAHHQRARDLVAELAEVYVVEQVLASLPPPRVELDVDAYETAGLASTSLLAAARSVTAEGRAEEEVIASLLADARREVAHLIGAAPSSAIEPVGVDAAWPGLPEVDRRKLLLARGDLQTLLAAWRTTDARYRYQVERQVPNLVLGLGGNVDLDFPMQLLQVELPLDAPAAALAAEQARRVAFHRLEEGVLDALHAAESASLEWNAAQARLEAAAERRKAAAALLTARQAVLATDSAGLDAVVLVAGRVVDAARQYREAGVAEARARVRAARAAGWPTPEIVGEDR